MANQVANRVDFERLAPSAQQGVLAVLETCKDHRLSVRCEMVGRDLNVVIGKGYSSPAFWFDQFTSNNQATG